MAKHVLILTTSLAGGGAERNAALLSRHLDAEVTVAVYVDRNHSYPHGGAVVNLQITPSQGVLGKLRNFIRNRKRLLRLKRDLDADVTISFLDPPNLMNLMTASTGRTIVSVRNYKSLEDRRGGGSLPRLGDWLLQFLYNRADKVVAVSHAVAQDLADNYGVRQDKLKVIYNACDVDEIRRLADQPLADHLGAIFHAPTIITAGRLQPQKGQWHLIRAFGRVREVVPDARLVILGQGDLYAYMSELSRALGLRVYSQQDTTLGEPVDGRNVFFLGYRKNPFAFLKRATLFALPSLYEGFPNVLLEAMACDQPILAADCLSGPREILAPHVEPSGEIALPVMAEFGNLLPVCDGREYTAADPLAPEEVVWADTIIEMLKDQNLREHYIKQSRRRVADFNVAGIMKEWERLVGEKD